MCVFFFFFFKQKTAYEMRISDWSSDVCSSDLKLVTVGIDDRHVPFAYHVDERLIAEALVAHLDRVAQLQAVLRIGKQVEEAREIVAIELLCRHELPVEDRKSTRLNSSH